MIRRRNCVCGRTSGWCRACWARALNRNPVVRDKLNKLSPEQIALVVDQIRHQPRRHFAEIAEDWMISYFTVRKIARENNVKRDAVWRRAQMAAQ